MVAASLTVEETARYSGWLRDAESAYNSLMLGKQTRVYVDQNGERVEFTMQKASDLNAYIMRLRTMLGKPLHGVLGPMQPRMF
jgi:hypothetical protein